MTHDARTGPVDSSWEHDLVAAVTVLLGHPVDAAAGPGYALYHRNIAVAEGGRRLLGMLEDAGALRRTWLPDDGTGRAEPLETCLSPDWGWTWPDPRSCSSSPVNRRWPGRSAHNRTRTWSPMRSGPCSATTGRTRRLPWPPNATASSPRWKALAARPGTAFVAAWDLAYFGEVSLAVMHTGTRT